MHTYRVRRIFNPNTSREQPKEYDLWGFDSRHPGEMGMVIGRDKHGQFVNFPTEECEVFASHDPRPIKAKRALEISWGNFTRDNLSAFLLNPSYSVTY